MSKARDLANAGTALTTVSATELGYLDGVTSAVQTQIDAKIPKTLTTTTGDTIYASSANTPARLGIGSTGQVLTVSGGVPSWATPSSGGMTLLSTTTLSGATTTISSIDQTYTNLFAIITSMTNNTADGNFRVALNSTGNSHDGVVVRYEQTSGTAAVSGFANDYIITPTVLARANATNTFTLLLPGYSNTTNAVWKTFNMFGRYRSTNSTAVSISGMYGDTSAITSLQFSNSGGTFAGGTVLLYGVK